MVNGDMTNLNDSYLSLIPLIHQNNMPKTITSEAYSHFLDCLRQTREKAGFTQEQIAERLGETQSFVSKCERGERRIDILELREFCIAMDTTLEKFVRTLERHLR